MATSRSERELLLDLSRVECIDAAGLGILVELHRWAQHHGVKLTIGNLSTPAHRLLTLVSLDRVLRIAAPETRAAAAGQWQKMTA
jgi:anti-anti-sigma factor